MNKLKLGHRGENLAKKYLINKGYVCLHENFRTRYGEIDLIMSYGDYTVFVEVKTRTSTVFGRPSEAVDARKREHIIKCALIYFQKYGECLARFDIIEILGNNITHIENAFEVS